MKTLAPFLVVASLVLPGCADVSESSDAFRDHNSGPPTCRRRNDYPTMIAVNELDASGTPTITGTDVSIAANGLITVSGSAEIDADIFAGGAVTINGNPDLYGDIYESSHQLRIAQDSTIDTVRESNDNDEMPCIKKKGSCERYQTGTDLVLNSKESLDLDEGVYYFTSIQIAGQANLNTDGNVWIYLDGGASFNGGSAVDEGDTLTLVSASDEPITINGSAEAAMHIMAPEATVKLAGTSGFVGSIVAYDIVLSGTTDLLLTHGTEAFNCPPLDDDYDG